MRGLHLAGPFCSVTLFVAAKIAGRVMNARAAGPQLNGLSALPPMVLESRCVQASTLSTLYAEAQAPYARLVE